MFGSLDGTYYDPMTGLPLNPEAPPDAVPTPDAPQSRLSKTANRLMGTQFGEERYQTFPEKMVREMISLPQRSLEAAAVPPGLRREDVTDIPAPSGPTADSTAFGNLMGIAPVAAQPNDALIGAGLEGAMATMGGTAFGAPARAGEAALGAGPLRKAPALDMSQEARMARATEQGFDGPWYHGSERTDRLTEAGKIDPKRATSGPMPFFTDNPAIASNYATLKSDTSLALRDVGNVSDYFTVAPRDLGIGGRSPISVERSWAFLPQEVKADILAKAKRVGYEDLERGEGAMVLHPDGVNGTNAGDQFDYLMKREHRGNPLGALRELWHDSGRMVGEESMMSDIYRLAGYPHQISEAAAPWTQASGVMPAMLQMKNPLNTENRDLMVSEVLPKLEEMFKGDRSRRKEFGADQWDKNTRYTPREWVEQAKSDYAAGDNSFVFTSIPDKVTEAFRKLGYDGILDSGGKGGGHGHRVAIPFGPEQVRSQFAKFDPKNDGKSVILGAGAADRRAAAAPAMAFTEQHNPILQRAFTEEMGDDAGKAAYEAYIAAHGEVPKGAPNVAAGEVAGAAGPTGAGGGAGSLEQAQAAAARWANGAQPLEGLPTKPLVIGGEHFVPGPIGSVQEIAKKYMSGMDRPYTPPTKYHPVDPEHSAAIARAFEEMPHTPNDPATQASYKALIDETAAQYRAIKDSGIKIEPIPPGAKDPYAENPRLAAKDVAENNHLWFFPTEGGFGSGAAADAATHPMLAKTGEKIGNHELLANDMFRVVHDIFGHLKQGHGFRAAGEDNAWRTHQSMYSDLARPAMTTETRGQNSWVNYGPHGEKNRTAKGDETVYADQKVGLMPEWTMRDRGSPEPTIAYHGTPFSFDKFDAANIGKGEGNQAYGNGLYFAESEPVSEFYRYQLAARRDPLLKKHDLDMEQAGHLGVSIAANKGDVAPIIKQLEESAAALRAEGRTDLSTKNMIKDRENKIAYLKDPDRSKGHLYQVAIDHPKENFLDWDRPLSEQGVAGERMLQIPEVAQAHQRQLEFLGPDKGLSGAAAYAAAAKWKRGAELSPSDPVAVTEAMKKVGIPGIKYLDQGSRGHGVASGSSNFVTFDAPRILKKYAIPGVGGGAAAWGALDGGRSDM